ncbi:MAG: ATP synthase F0 subunit A [Planctomycetes bacterium]|nr:ATP synthase F0 subunit A [Planctomycetota bacterium]
MNLLRPILILAVIVGAIFVSTNYTEHHAGSNADPMDALYAHVVPAKLVFSDQGHGHGDQGTADHIDGHAVDDDHEHEAVGVFGLPESMAPTNLQVFQLAAILLILIAFGGVGQHLRTGKGDKLTRILAGWVTYIRDEMVRPNMQRGDEQQFLPYFLYLFFFIVFMNLMGLVPGGATATASIFVTAALALTTLVAMLGCGMVSQGPIKFWTGLVPQVPAWLWPLMFVVEVFGLFIKPFALMIRLFANMTGGHLVVLSFMGLIFYFAGTDYSSIGWAVSPPAVALAVFIMIIEGFVALLQAYIFTQLTIMFVGTAVHPEH